MLDPAVWGTLLIGLGAERAKSQGHRRRRPVAAPVRRPLGIRMALARSLRRVAAVLEGPTVGEVANQTH
jgi:hypothetical protein